MNEIKLTEHIVYNCKYHIIFCPKYRRKILTDKIADRLKEIFIEVSNEYEFNIIEMEIMPDHVHLLIDCNPRFGIMNCVRRLKAISYRTLRSEFPEIDRRLPTLWTRSVYIGTVGSVSLDIIKQYIENQKKS